MLPEEIPVKGRKHIETFRESIIPRTQEEVPEIMTSLLPIARKEKVTGKIELNLANGGVRSISLESTKEIVEK